LATTHVATLGTHWVPTHPNTRKHHDTQTAPVNTLSAVGCDSLFSVEYLPFLFRVPVCLCLGSGSFLSLLVYLVIRCPSQVLTSSAGSAPPQGGPSQGAPPLTRSSPAIARTHMRRYAAVEASGAALRAAPCTAHRSHKTSRDANLRRAAPNRPVQNARALLPQG